MINLKDLVKIACLRRKRRKQKISNACDLKVCAKIEILCMLKKNKRKKKGINSFKRKTTRHILRELRYTYFVYKNS